MCGKCWLDARRSVSWMQMCCDLLSYTHLVLLCAAAGVATVSRRPRWVVMHARVVSSSAHTVTAAVLTDARLAATCGQQHNCSRTQMHPTSPPTTSPCALPTPANPAHSDTPSATASLLLEQLAPSSRLTEAAWQETVARRDVLVLLQPELLNALGEFRSIIFLW